MNTANKYYINFLLQQI